MAAYYNEHDKHAAAWLRQLVADGLIADGIVDHRSIANVTARDLDGFTQCHFFAGVGIWSYALRKAGWPDDRPVWTGSCPCQSFSQAGTKKGLSDKRHLWPVWYELIRELEPEYVFGEQVSSKNAEPWIDVVSAQMENQGYAFGALDSSSAVVGAPHLRQRFYFSAMRLEQSERDGSQRRLSRRTNTERQTIDRSAGCNSTIGWMGHGSQQSGKRNTGKLPETEAQGDSQRIEDGCERDRHSDASENVEQLSDTASERCRETREISARPSERPADDRSAVNGFWRDSVWLSFKDGKARPVESVFTEVADGYSSPLVQSSDQGPSIYATSEARAMRIKGYGNAINAINAEHARIFIECVIETEL